MSVRELPSSAWPQFFEELGRDRRAWLATVDRSGSVEAREQPLESISAGERIAIHIGGRAIYVNEPQAVRVESTAEGAPSAVQIDDATGRRLTLRFRISVAPGALDGIAPSER